MKRPTMPAAFLAACALSYPLLAQAHHAMGNALPGNAFEGLLSGLAHPVIGLDHFVFVLALGAACYYFGQRVLGIGVFLVAALAGAVLHVNQATVAFVEFWVAASLLLLGLAVLRTVPKLKSMAGMAFVAAAGLAHGYAYGESIVGAEQTPLLAYLAGFTLIQCVVALAGFLAARQADRMHRSAALRRTVGATASIAGVAFLLVALAG